MLHNNRIVDLDVVMEIAVVVEIPKGSRNKYEMDKATGRIRFDRMLFSPVHYPTDYGFVPDTLAADGDPLDAMVLLWEPTFPGCLIEVRPIAVFQMHDDKGQDEKILSVPLSDPHWNRL
ncbi:MAG: inorganic diphosphatase, partial [Bdellovibrionales bacterium]|nr:inorganic diphosphatase [Bdellovibrionales bacterium]